MPGVAYRRVVWTPASEAPSLTSHWPVQWRFMGAVGEQHDTTPTALDFVIYAITGSSRLLSALALLAYPAAVSVFFAEATWIWLGVRSSGLPFPAREPLLIIGAAFLVAALPGLAILWWRKVLKLKRGIEDLWVPKRSTMTAP